MTVKKNQHRATAKSAGAFVAPVASRATGSKYTILRDEVYAPEGGNGPRQYVFAVHSFRVHDGLIVHAIDGKDRAVIHPDNWADYTTEVRAAALACQNS